MIHIYKNEGLRRFWRGIFPMAVFAAPTLLTKHVSTLSFAQDVNNQPTILNSITRGYMVTGLTSFVGVIFNVFALAYTKMAADLRFPEHVGGDAAYKEKLAQYERYMKLHALGEAGDMAP
eukprot:UN04793